MSSITKLPPEVLEHIIIFLPTASDISHFSKTAKSIHEVVEKDGWRTFVWQRFPSISTSPIWRDSAHALTTLSRNLDRRAFVSHEFEPHGQITRLPEGIVQDHWDRPKGQTMGYQAVLDTHEEWTGSDWASRRRVVAWGAGAELVINVSEPQSKQAASSSTSSRSPQRSRKQAPSAKTSNDDRWLSYREKEHVEGRDDITSVNMVKSSQQLHGDQSTHALNVVIGRANGELALLNTSTQANSCEKMMFNTRGSPVRAADISPGQQTLLAACLNDHRLVTYPLNGMQDVAQPVGETLCVATDRPSSQAWAVRFLSKDKVAVGVGPSKDFLKVFNVGSEGLSKEPIRNFGNGNNGATSAKTLRPLPTSSASTANTDDQLVLSGCYDGVIRLHDLRSPSEVVSVVRDPVDNSAIFSLETIGRERIIAGSSSHSLLKIFDLRMVGGRAYDYCRVKPAAVEHAASDSPGDSVCHKTGFNIFVGQNRQISSSRRRQPKESPIYSLSRPSQASPLLYAGLENSVVEFNFTSVTDAHPDPVFKHRLKHERGRFDPLDTWFSSPPYALTLYEQAGSRNMQMLYQRNLGRHRSGLSVQSFEDCERGYDERLSRISTSTRLSAARSNFSR